MMNDDLSQNDTFGPMDDEEEEGVGANPVDEDEDDTEDDLPAGFEDEEEGDVD